MAVARKTEDMRAQDPSMAIQETDPGFTTDSTALASDSDAEKGHGAEKVRENAVEAEKADQLEVQGAQLYVLMGSILLAAFAMAMNGTILGTALPAITAEFKTVDDVGWYAAAYLIAKLVE